MRFHQNFEEFFELLLLKENANVITTTASYLTKPSGTIEGSSYNLW